MVSSTNLRGALNPTICIVDEDIEQYQSQVTGRLNISQSLQLQEEIQLVMSVVLGATSATVYPLYANFGRSQGCAMEKNLTLACIPCCHGVRQQ